MVVVNYELMTTKYESFIDTLKGLDPESIHKQLLQYLLQDPMSMYVALRNRLQLHGIYAEFPEYAPIVHFLKVNLHTPEINDLCASDNIFGNLRRHADLALWHVSQSDSWYPYLSTLKGIYLALQFFDIFERKKQPSLDQSVPLYHEFRYMYYFDKVLEWSSKGELVIFPTYLGLGASPFINTRGPPIFIVGVNIGLNHVDEFVQTPAEFFIHDVNHSRRLYQNSLNAYETRGYKEKMSLDEFYLYQFDFVQTHLKPLYTIAKEDSAEEKAIKQALKIILFEVVHEDAEPALPDVLCDLVLRKPGIPTSFQIIVDDPEKGTKDIKKVIIPGGGLLAFVKYKLRYGFMDPITKSDGTSGLNTRIASREARTTESIARAADRLLHALGCKDVPSIDGLRELIDDMTGQNPPVHPNHLGEPVNVSKFTGVRPPPLPYDFFERQYTGADGSVVVPWTGIVKIIPKFEELNLSYKESVGATPRRNNKTYRKRGGQRKSRRNHKK